MKYYLIAKNNIKRAKIASVTLILLVAIATIFLYVGTQVIMQIDGFVEGKNEAINGADEIIIADRALDEQVKEIYEGTDGFVKMQRTDGVLFGTVKLSNKNLNEVKFSMPVLIQKRDDKRTISKIKMTQDSDKAYENGVVLPYVLKAANGYQIGDTIVLSIDNKDIELTIAGFNEDVMFSTATNLMMYNFYVSNDTFQKLEQENGAVKCSISLALIKNRTDGVAFENEIIEKIKREVSDISLVYITSNYQSLKVGASVFVLIITSVLIAFSGIILIVSMIVIRFSATNHIENNIKNIGAMEAIGYTPRQLLFAILLEYGITASIGVIVGILLSFGIAPVVSKVISSSNGLNWIAMPSSKAVIITLIVIISFVLLFSYTSAVKIKKITPLTALRSGIETHNFKKVCIPLAKTRWNLSIAMSMKEFLYNKRQNVVAGIIIMLLSVVCVLALSMYYNFVIDTSSMMRLVGIENAQVEMNVTKDTLHLIDEVAKMKEVSKVTKLEAFGTTIRYKDKMAVPNFQVTEDYDNLQIKTIIQGRMPKHANEITTTVLVLDELGAKIGDTVLVEYNDSSKEYLVVGITQHISYLGKGAEITTEGLKRLDQNFEGTTAMVYLKDNVDTDQFISKLSNRYHDELIQLKNNKETLDKMLTSFAGAIRIISIGCLVIAGMIITFIMFLVVRTRVNKEKMHMGISKALGFTSKQLSGHILMSQSPVIMVSAILGSVAGYYLTNPMIALSLASNGILRCNFYIPLQYVILTAVGISILGFFTVLVISMRIRKISPMQMISQREN